MTTDAHRQATKGQIAHDIRRCSEAPARAAHREDAAWESYFHLLNTCQFRRARQWWVEEIAPTFQQQ